MNEKTSVAEQVSHHVQDNVHWTTQAIEYVWNFLIAHMMDFIGAALILLIGFWLAKFFRNMAQRMMEKSRIDKSVMGFVSQIIYFLIILIVIIAALGKLGVPTTSFVAALGGIGVGVGLALKDNVSNFAAGLLILMFRPFRVGDYVMLQGAEGTVTSITIMNTHLKTLGNQDVVIPNNIMTSSVIKNYSTYHTRCSEMYIDVGYNTDLEKTVALLRKLFDEEEGVLNPITMPIGVREFGDNSIRIYARPEIKADDYWDVYYRLMVKIKKMFDEEGIDIPYPQRVLHIQQETVAPFQMPEAPWQDKK